MVGLTTWKDTEELAAVDVPGAPDAQRLPQAPLIFT